jgi:TolA-binding protein
LIGASRFSVKAGISTGYSLLNTFVVSAIWNIMEELNCHTKRVVHALCVVPAISGAMLLSATFSMTAAAAPAPVYDAVAQSATVSDLERRVNRIETRLNNQSLANLIQRVDQLQRDMQKLIGDIEVQNHELNSLKQRQRKLYSDIDQRLRALEGTASSSSSAAGQLPSTAGGSPLKPVPVTPVQPGSRTSGSAQSQTAPSPTMTEVERTVARSAYERGFNLLKQGRYQLAAQSLEAFLESYPKAAYADNAQYWLGEANYAQQNYKVALKDRVHLR